MIIINCEQNSPEWFAEKLGKPSASNASMIVTTAGKQSKQRTGYMDELAAERITGQRYEGYSNKNMEIGNEREDECRALYGLLYNVEIKKVGVVYMAESKRFLCSPDGIINNEYGIEMKNVIPKTQVRRLIEGKLPTEYFSQIQFSLLVTGFKRWDFVSYCPGLKPLIIQVNRDEKFISVLATELNAFCKELDEITEKIR